MNSYNLNFIRSLLPALMIAVCTLALQMALPRQACAYSPGGSNTTTACGNSGTGNCSNCGTVSTNNNNNGGNHSSTPPPPPPPPTPTCQAGYVPSNTGSCVPSIVTGSCPPGYTLGLDNICYKIVWTLTPPSGPGGAPSGTPPSGLSCPAGFTLVTHPTYASCVGHQICPAGYSMGAGNICFYKGTSSIFRACPAGKYYGTNGGCWLSYCPTPTQRITNETGGTCAACPVGYTAIRNVCTAPSVPTIVVWTVKPELVRSGNTSIATWEAHNVISCSITGTNGDSWGGSCVPGGLCKDSKQTGAIVGQTIYTINCSGPTGAAAKDTATVNVVPAFQEH